MGEDIVDVNLTNFIVIFFMLILIEAIFAGGWLFYESYMTKKGKK